MNPPEEILTQARALDDTDTDHAMELRSIVANGSPSPAWSEARVELAIHEYGIGQYDQALDHLTAVVAAPRDRITLGAQAVAGVLTALCVQALDGAIDLELLDRSVEQCLATGHPVYSGTGLMTAAMERVARGERDFAKDLLARAIEILSATDPNDGGASARLELAKLEAADGRHAEARQQIEAALAFLATLPVTITSRKITQRKLVALRDSLPTESP